MDIFFIGNICVGKSTLIKKIYDIFTEQKI